MFQKSYLRSAIARVSLISLSGVLGGVSHFSQAEEQVATNLEEVTVIGSRRAAATATDTLVPVDTIGGDDISKSSSSDMLATLSGVVPSYNVSQQPNNDESAFIRPANLRTLPPDNTLVLVNGKRRHRGAVISFLGEGISDGAQGADVSVFPSLAIKGVQVLRDGAAAQYGSDAIAGVINFQLKDEAEGGALMLQTGQFYEGDGTSAIIAGNIGMPITDSGFLNLTAEYSYSELTSRSVQRSDAAAIAEAGNDDVEDLVMIWGAPEVDNNYKLFFNSGIELNYAAELYAFGNYASKDVETEFFYRNPHTRQGVFTEDGGETILVADLNLSNDITCPVVAVNNNALDANAYGSISAGGALDSECFSFNEMFPGGFTPRMGGTIQDTAFAVGVRGDITAEFSYDFSANWGRSATDYYLNDSVNASLGPNSPTYFELGENIQTDTNVNLDLVYALPVSFLASDLNIAGGAEWRNEEFEVIAGDENSYQVGPYSAQGFSSGSNGFAGFSPSAEGVFSRSNIALYMDLEADVTERFTVGVAARWEDFEDFGSTTNGKLSMRYGFSDVFAIRGSLSSGFRAPTPGQANITRSSTEGTQDDEGNFVFLETGIFPATNPIVSELSLLAGGVEAKALGPEKSNNGTLGFVFDTDAFSLTADYFYIKVEDRIALTSRISIDRSVPEQAEVLKRLEEQGVPGSSTYSSFQFFTNDFETVTQGIDIVGSVPVNFGVGESELQLSYNHTETELARLTKQINEERKTQLEDGLPKNRFTLTGKHSQGRWDITSRINYYGKYVVDSDRNSNFSGIYGEKMLVDLDVGYSLTDTWTVNVGANNLFDTYPDKHPSPADNSGQIYPEQSPFGFNGGYYYLRISSNF